MTNIISFSVRDSDGDSNSVPVYLDESFTLAQYQAFVTAFAPLLDAVIGGVIDSASLQLSLALPGGLGTDPTAGIENQRGANLSFATTTRYSHGVRIPALSDTFFSGKDVVTTGAMATLINAYTGGLDDGGGTQLIPRDKYGNDLVSLASAVKSFRKR